MIEALLAWWRRSVKVDQPDPERMVSRIVLDHGDGRVEMMLAHRNDTFSLAWICTRAREEGLRQMTLTLTNEGNPEGFQYQTMTVPNWARDKLIQGAIRIALDFGWRGQCPAPMPLPPPEPRVPRQDILSVYQRILRGGAFEDE